MNRLKLPKNHYKGIKVFCHKCKRDNPSCKHYELFKFRVRVHVAGTKKAVKSKVLTSLVYSEAVKEAIEFEEEIKKNNYQSITISDQGHDYSISDAVLKYNRYLSGKHEMAHKIKNVSAAHNNECIRFCTHFCKSINPYKNITITKIIAVNQNDVARFYSLMDKHYAGKTFNKCMQALKAFFKFLIEVEGISMTNPFEIYEPKSVVKKQIFTLTKAEFELILASIETANPRRTLGGRGEVKNMYRPYLKDGFKLFLLTGGRREEVINLKWTDIIITGGGTKFFAIENLKVNRIKKKNEAIKYIPINDDLFSLLQEMGYEEKNETSGYILFSDRDVQIDTIKNDMSKAFTHYVKESGIKKEVGLKDLRKTYITWVNHAMGEKTGLLTSHAGEKVLKDYYIDPSILNAIEEAVLKVKVFGV